MLLVVRGRRREERRLPLKLNDGHWHHVALSSVDRKATLSVEAGGSRHNSSAQLKLPKRISAANAMFVGGIFDNSLSLPSEMVSLENCLWLREKYLMKFLILRHKN